MSEPEIPFSEEDFRGLLELDTDIADLVGSPGWEALKQQVQAVMDADERRLLGGKMKDIREYDMVCWRRLGAQSVFDHAEKVVPQRVNEYRRQMAERQSPDESFVS